ncbi:glucosamine-6-phosphate deaminase [Peribacillus butanolivorans]|uniref:glucosamine-6-phosphate deaminase n=1 Tax=Peribacillus TaxID=2675229 RepID=UPI001914C212|nr:MULTISPECIES: glucosamine-6-phosphate deaminase [unclassified Peribacillus]MBK5444486.1 glucosamine-6-phosphate deaminase [Peribacillus sp. TH24]MBK5460810.1 glucosamine-6-phosphate deaminase [Peribacillus sp. TH27]MBK5485875.1 glucosamine-6-phosphate deaminase [Peribacillus sp. TH16]MBK5498953.1 glucosamine-6-phosphate deaminase [Peribacillus sp. TH14]WMX55945.1 glucosamine-6-phosphate deaminase [Peribacillus sp. R9-11]
MNIIKVQDYKEMSQSAANIVIRKVKENSKIKLGLATGGTPKGTYDTLIEDHMQNNTSYENVTSFNLDEYIGLDSNDPNSYHYYMDQSLFAHININKEQTYLPNGTADNLDKECTRFDKMIETLGGIDLQILGIGQNGHIGFNEPGTSFSSGTHVVALEESTRQANARYFDSIDEVPTHAITMGIATIMKSKEILLLISGEEKAETLKKLIHGEITEEFPASILKKHNNVTIIADQKALSGVLIP